MELRDQGNSATLAYAPLTTPSRVQPRLCDRLLQQVDRHRHALIAGLFFFYLLGFNGQWRIERDSALYLTVGRNLAQGSGYTYQGQVQPLIFPGLPLMFAGIFRVFHTTSTTPAVVAMFLLGLTGLALTYRLFLLHSDRPTALMIMLGLGMTRLFYRYSFELLSDMPFLVGVTAFLVGYEAVFFARRRKSDRLLGPDGPIDYTTHKRAATVCWLDWTLLFGGLGFAIVMRPVMWVLLLAIVLSLITAAVHGAVSWKKICVALIVIAAAAVAFHFFDPRLNGSGSLGQYEDYLLEAKFARMGPMLKEMFKSNIPDVFEAAGVKALFGCPILPGINTLGGLVVVGLSLWLLKERALWGFWATLTLLMLFMFKPLDRYFLPVIPLLVYAWWKLLVYLNHRLPPQWGDKVFLGLLVLGVSTNLARLGEIIVEQRRVPFLEHYHDGRYASVREVRDLVYRGTHQHDWILAEPKCGRVLSFISNRYAVEPSETVRLDARAQPVYALIGPSWDGPTTGETGRDPSADPVVIWLQHHGYALGPVIDAPVQGRRDREPWTLHRVIAPD